MKLKSTVAVTCFLVVGILRVDEEPRHLKREIDILRREGNILKKHCPSSSYRKVKIAIYARQCVAIEGGRDGSVLGVSRSRYYHFSHRKISKRQQENDKLQEMIKTIFTKSRCTYDSPRIHAELKAQGIK